MVETRFFRFCRHISKVILSLVAWNPFKALPVCCRSFLLLFLHCYKTCHSSGPRHYGQLHKDTNNLFGSTVEHGMRRTQIC